MGIRRLGQVAPAAIGSGRSVYLQAVVAAHLAAILVAPLAGETAFAGILLSHLSGIVRQINFAGQARDGGPGHGCPPFLILR